MSVEVSGIFVINLETRPERWQYFVEGLPLWQESFGQTPQRYPAVAGLQLSGYGQAPWFRGRLSEARKKSWGGKAGCVLSHRNVIAQAVAQDWANVLVLEDDAYLKPENVPLWRNGLQELLSKLPKDWAVVNFCTTMPITPCCPIETHEGTRVVEACGSFGAVAYLVNGRIFQQLLAELPEGQDVWRWVARHKTIDRWFSQNLMRFGRVYLTAPALINHRSIGSSDISMSAQNDWQLDFVLDDLPLIENRLLFVVLKKLRQWQHALQRQASIGRLALKRWRGF
jgi:glycosyl transferase family 25